MSVSGLEERISLYKDLVLRWNSRISLIGRKNPEAALTRLINHSLEGEKALPEGIELLVDVGSGAGLPGIPMALKRPGMQVKLVERSANKCVFLREVRRSLGLANVEIVEEGFEPSMLAVIERKALTALAVGNYVEIAKGVAPVLKEGDGLLLFVSMELAGEIAETGLFSLDSWRVLSGGDRTGVAWLTKVAII
jgi:16S rRNA (guanine527-N7)-methyltransferase